MSFVFVVNWSNCRMKNERLCLSTKQPNYVNAMRRCNANCATGRVNYTRGNRYVVESKHPRDGLFVHNFWFRNRNLCFRDKNDKRFTNTILLCNAFTLLSEHVRINKQSFYSGFIPWNEHMRKESVKNLCKLRTK